MFRQKKILFINYSKLKKKVFYFFPHKYKDKKVYRKAGIKRFSGNPHYPPYSKIKKVSFFLRIISAVFLLYMCVYLYIDDSYGSMP